MKTYTEIYILAPFSSEGYADAEGKDCESVCESMSLLQRDSYAALYHGSIEAREIQVKVRAWYRNNLLHYTKGHIRNKTPKRNNQIGTLIVLETEQESRNL